MAKLTGGDLSHNTSVGGHLHPKPLKVTAADATPLHGDLSDNSQVGRPNPEPVSIVLPDGTDFAAWYANVKAYITAHP